MCSISPFKDILVVLCTGIEMYGPENFSEAVRIFQHCTEIITSGGPNIAKYCRDWGGGGPFLGVGEGGAIVCD